jgi:hypothetical protein
MESKEINLRIFRTFIGGDHNKCMYTLSNQSSLFSEINHDSLEDVIKVIKNYYFIFHREGRVGNSPITFVHIDFYPLHDVSFVTFPLRHFPLTKEEQEIFWNSVKDIDVSVKYQEDDE